jgi:hypothetical protein
MPSLYPSDPSEILTQLFGAWAAKRTQQLSVRQRVLFAMGTIVTGGALGLTVGLALGFVFNNPYAWWIGAAIGVGVGAIVVGQVVIWVLESPPSIPMNERIEQLAKRLQDALTETASAVHELDAEVHARAETLRLMEEQQRQYDEIKQLSEEQLASVAQIYAGAVGPRERRSFWINVAFTVVVSVVTTAIGVGVTLATAK